MIILNGEFHGDPHPGNVFLIGEQDVGFIDFGSVGTLTKARREELVRLVMAIADEDTADVANVLLGWAGDPKVDRDRSEERSEGKEVVRTCRSRWSPYH